MDNKGTYIVSDSVTIHKNAKGGEAVFLTTPDAAKIRQCIETMIPVRDVKMEKGSKLRYIHKITDTSNIYYFANISRDSIDDTILMRGKIEPELWDPHTGKVSKAAYIHLSERGEEQTKVKIQLPANHSCFLVAKH